MYKIWCCIVLALVLLALMVAPTRAEEDVTSWTKDEVAMEVLYEVLSAIDYGQTMWIVKNPVTYQSCGAGCVEKVNNFESYNFALGKHPSRDKVRAYFLTNAILHPVLVHYTPVIAKAMGASDEAARITRKVVQGFSIGLETGVVAHNIEVFGGFKFEF